MSDEGTTPLRDFAASILLILGLWQTIVWLTGVPHYILPGPLAVAAALADNLLLIAWHARVTAIEVILGMIFGVVLGAISALYLMISPFARRFSCRFWY